MKKRIHLYDHHVGLVVEQLKYITDQRHFDVEFLARVKEIYTGLLPDYPRFEIAESFFNSVYCRLFKHRDLTPDKLFVFSSQPERRFREIPRPLARDFIPKGDLSGMLQMVLNDLSLRLHWENLSRDIDYIVMAIRQAFTDEQLASAHFQIANELFYRNKAAWLVGKLRLNGDIYPFLLPIHHNESGELFIDTCLTSKAEASIVFGFARSYLWSMCRCRLQWWNGYGKYYRVNLPLSCIRRLAVRNTVKQRVIASIWLLFINPVNSLLLHLG